MTLLTAQIEFGKSLVRLFTWIDLNGYEWTGGELYRPPEMAQIYASQGKGILCSLHTQRLAIDLNIFKNHVLLVSVEDLRPVGEFWESLSIPELPHNWGGSFTTRPDADHFSVSIDNERK